MDIFKKKNSKNSDPFSIQELPIRDFRLGEERNLEWVEENIKLDAREEATTNFGKNNRPKEFLGLALNQKRLTIFLFFIFGILAVLFAKTAYLQVIKGNYYRQIAEGNRIRVETISAERGIIYDRNLRPLVKNIPAFSLYLIPSDFPKDEDKRQAVLGHLAEIIKMNPGEIEKKLENISPYSYTPVLLKENMEYEEAIRLKIESAYLSGVSLKLESRREYLKGDNDEVKSLSHILGYVGKINEEELEELDGYEPIDLLGKTGIELFYENLLRGKNGKKQIEVDVLGKEKSVIAKEEPTAGKNIILTLDLDLQKKMEEILASRLAPARKFRAAAVVLNPKSGRILSLVSLPTFDNNLFARGISSQEYSALLSDNNNPLFNRAIMGEYPSGSTIKPVIAAAAIEEEIIKQNTSFNSTGGLQVSRWFFPDWKAGGHGWTNVTRAIAESINTFFYIIGGGYEDFNGLGVDRIVKYVKLFGLGEKLGVDLPHETSGLLPTEEWKEKTKGEQWYIGDTYHLSIGQGDILVTPLQIAAATSVFANGGTLYRPHLLSGVEGIAEQSAKNYIIRQDFIGKENIDIVRAGLRQAVTSGSAEKMLGLSVTSAGKTGTAQWSTTKLPHAWFTAFAPYDNPEIVVTVLVEEGEGGSRIALDIAYDFLQWYFNR
jgi:penicillin-binding protein 2